MIERSVGIYIERDSSRRIQDMPGPHVHQCHELYFLRSGARRYLIGPRLYDVAPGDVVLIPRTELHRTIALDQQGYERQVVYFYEEALSGLWASIGPEVLTRLLQQGCLRLPRERLQEVRLLLEEMEREQDVRDAYTQAVLSNLLGRVLLLLLRHGIPLGQAPDEKVRGIQAAIAHIHHHYAADLTLAEAARIACMEETYFSKRFKAETGFGFQEYLIQTRIAAAEKLLQFSTASIRQVAAQCGFSSSTYFGDVFRRVTGCAPSTYRRTQTIHQSE